MDHCVRLELCALGTSVATTTLCSLGLAIALLVMGLRMFDEECESFASTVVILNSVLLIGTAIAMTLLFSLHLTLALTYGGILKRTNRRAYHACWIMWIVFFTSSIFLHSFGALLAAAVFLQGGLPSVDDSSPVCVHAQAFGFVWSLCYGAGVTAAAITNVALVALRFPKWLRECKGDDCVRRFVDGEPATDASGAFLDGAFSAQEGGGAGRGGMRFDSWASAPAGPDGALQFALLDGTERGAGGAGGGMMGTPPATAAAAAAAEGGAPPRVERTGSGGTVFSNPLAQRPSRGAAPLVPHAAATPAVSYEYDAGPAATAAAQSVYNAGPAVVAAPALSVGATAGDFREGGGGSSLHHSSAVVLQAVPQDIAFLKLEVRRLRTASRDDGIPEAARARFAAEGDAKLAEMRRAIHSMAAAGDTL